ncbi:hypothetical protein K501DRAFT_331107 [Backusella circina FSU 941]|nr:hypothetical protein K501DRAFT_331107 [Backusella circina FSU 941]
MPKRDHQDITDASSSSTNTLKKSRSNQHTADCSDKLCQGCDVGQVEISFVRKDGVSMEPSAQELLAMAMEEASANPDVAGRLFDMAIEKFQKEEPENRTGYAVCLVELGKALDVEESISEGLEILRGEFKTTKDLKLASAAIVLATHLRKAQEAYFEQQAQELEGSDGEIEDEIAYSELLQKQEVSKREIKLYKEAIEHTKEAQMDDLKEMLTTLHELRTYGQLLSQPFHKEHSDAVLGTVTDVIKTIPDYEKDDELLNLYASCLLHQEKFLEEVEEKNKMLEEAEKLLVASNRLHKEKHGEENPRVLEMFAMLRINQSNLTEDEDQTLDLFEDAINAFKKAAKLSPDNPKLTEMVNMLQGLQEQQE